MDVKERSGLEGMDRGEENKDEIVMEVASERSIREKDV